MTVQDQAQEYVLTQLAEMCGECAAKFTDADIKEMAEESGLSVRDIKESTKIMTEAFRAEQRRLQDRITFLRNGKR